MAISLIEFVLEFYPVQAQGVQEAFHDIHAHENSKGNISENEEANENHKYLDNLHLNRLQEKIRF